MRTQKYTSVILVLLLLSLPRCHAQVYAQAIYSAGHSYWSLSSTTLPFAPYKYSMTKITWVENTNGDEIWDPAHQADPGNVVKRSLKVECGSETFTLLLDSIASQSLKGSGDLAQLLTQCVTNRGGRVATNALPVIQSKWMWQSHSIGDNIVIDGDHFTEIQKLLERAYGKPEAGIISTDLNVNGQSLTYTPAQIGVTLNLTFGADLTIVSVIGKQKL